MATTSKTLATVAKPKAPTLTEQNKSLRETMEAVSADRERLEEALSNAVLMLRQEDVGWAFPGEDGTYRGLTVRELKRWSEQIRASLTGTELHAPNPHMRNGIMLRHSFIWSGGIHYADVPGSDEKPVEDQPGSASKNAPKRGKVNVHDLIHKTENQRLFFGNSARRRREASLYSDGIYLAVGDDTKKTLRPVPLSEITATLRDDLYQDDIIAYRWTRMEAQRNPGKSIKGVVTPGSLTGERLPKSYWVYVDWYDGDKPDQINFDGATEDVLKGHTAFDLHANRPDGAAFGSPDAISALVWARIIRDLIMNGVKMQDALAMFAFKATSPSKAGQQNQAVEVARPNQAGSAVTMGDGNNFDALSTAGKGYDFGSIGFVVSTMAASLHVSGIALAANTALAGSSYGAAKTLDLPGQMAMETRRREHIEYDERVLSWMGAPKATAYFDAYTDEADTYRAVQAAMLAWTTGTLSPEGFREELDIIYGRKMSGPIPDGAINPNTETEADREAAAAAKVPLVGKGDVGQITAKAPPKRAAKQAPAANQGVASGAGGSGHLNDPPQGKK